MSIFVRTVTPVTPVSRTAFYASIFSAAVLVVAATAQLFAFEDFPAVLAGYLLPGGYGSALLLAALLVTVEVLAVPYLLMMRLSPLMRGLSLVCGWLSCLIWLVLGWLGLIQGGVSNSGLLGTTVSVPFGWPTLVFVAGVSIGLIATDLLAIRRLVSRR